MPKTSATKTSVDQRSPRSRFAAVDDPALTPALDAASTSEALRTSGLWLDVDDADGLVTLSAAARSFCRASASSARRTSLRDMRFAATRSDPSGFFLGEKNGMPSLRLGSAGGDRARLSSSAQSDLVGRRAVSCSRARTMVCAGDGEKVSPVGRVNVPSMALAGLSILKGPGHARARWGSRTHQLVLAVAVHHRGEYIGRAEVLGAAVGGRRGPWRADGHLLTVSDLNYQNSPRGIRTPGL